MSTLTMATNHDNPRRSEFEGYELLNGLLRGSVEDATDRHITIHHFRHLCNGEADAHNQVANEVYIRLAAQVQKLTDQFCAGAIEPAQWRRGCLATLRCGIEMKQARMYATAWHFDCETRAFSHIEISDAALQCLAEEWSATERQFNIILARANRGEFSQRGKINNQKLMKAVGAIMRRWK